ncbi:MAG: ketoacyl-ACP synthase III [Deltaproteobacteria bacterium]|jgi:3-oxoacyl-[acyl-carrier-protein] synthase-3|nr:MAG: ketoacyl-ACP synthase III [Deltaproteobacteria bacterium]
MSGKATIIGTGSYLPKHILTNKELEKIVETSDEWITTRTGIKTRRIAGAGEETSYMATQAATRAMEMAGITAPELDMIIVGTITPEMVMPSCACLVQKEIGAENAFAFDVSAACSGFVYALEIADRYVKNAPDMKILVIGAETLSSRVNWQDRNTCVLFGDGAGASVVTGSSSEEGLLASQLYSDGRLWRLLSLDAVPRRYCPVVDYGTIPDRNNFCDGSAFNMVGKDVFKYAVREMGDAVENLLNREGVSLDDIDLLIPHQANIRILKSLAERVNLSFDKVYTTIQKYGNSSAASLPVALDEANREGRLQKGDLLLFSVFGGGFTWGVVLWRW